MARIALCVSVAALCAAAKGQDSDVVFRSSAGLNWIVECQIDCPTTLTNDLAGFTVWVSGKVYDDPNFSFETMGIALDALKAEFSTAHNLAGPEYRGGTGGWIGKLQETNLSLYLVGGTPGPGEFETTREYIGNGVYQRRPGALQDPNAFPWKDPWVHNFIHYDSERKLIVFSIRSLLIPERRGTVVHELAHAYHDLVVTRGFNNECIKEAYRLSVEVDGLYNQVPFFNEYPDVPDGRPSGNTYRDNNALEYFAVSAQAYWLYGTTGHYPWDRESLWEHDKRAYRLMQVFLEHSLTDCDVLRFDGGDVWWPR